MGMGPALTPMGSLRAKGEYCAGEGRVHPSPRPSNSWLRYGDRRSAIPSFAFPRTRSCSTVDCMNRRTFLKHVAVIPALPVLPSRVAIPEWIGATIPLPSARRARPSDPSWPTAADWKRLKHQVGGRLIPVSSPLAPCKDAPGSAACASRIEEMKNPYFIGEQAGGTQTSGWLEGWTSAPSVYAVVARGTEDVVAAVNFARDNNLRLVVRGGGHSYQGTSNATDSLLIWTREMQAITLHDTFVPVGCIGTAPRPAVTIESGARWLPAYQAVTTTARRYVQGGGCATVGVAGLIQSGGFGSFSKNYGLAAASLLQAEIVAADGKVLIANTCDNPDLYWALKGGGGGSFGVVTKVTLATYELPEFFGTVQGSVKANSDAAFRKLIGSFLRFYAKELFNSHWGESVSFQSDNTLLVHMVFQGLEQSQADATWKLFLDFLAASPQDFNATPALKIQAIPAQHYWDPEYRQRVLPGTMVADNQSGASPENISWLGNQMEVNIFLYGYESVWLPASLLKQQERLADTVFASTRHFEVQLHFNKGLAGAPDDKVAAARDTAMNPAVLDAFALALIAGGDPHTLPGVPGHEPDLAAGRKAAAAIMASANNLRAIVQHAGAYVSEGNFFDKKWQTSFWGSNYGRLAAVKKKYDPAGLFFVHHGVGSEEWSDDGFTKLVSP
jgi:FAD/FMN-containing dehydrogenase